MKIVLRIMFALFFLCLFVVPAEGADDQMVDLERIEGNNSVERAVEISRKGWESSSVVVLVRSGESADALAAAPLAYHHEAPLLITGEESLDEITREEIERLQAEEAIILGGELAVSFDVELELRGMDLEVDRLWGRDRYETAARVAQELKPFDKAVIVNGENFPDALSISPYAAQRGYPLLLTLEEEVPAVTLATLEGVENTILVGGTSTISTRVEEKLPGPVRINGSDRYRTSRAITSRFDVNRETLYISDGEEVEEALPGTLLAARGNNPLLLVKKDSLDEAGIKELVEAYNSRNSSEINREISRVVILAEGSREEEKEEGEAQQKVEERSVSFTQRGIASWYGARFHGRRTASGEPFDQYALTAAHRTLPFGTRVNVKFPATGKEVTVRINDRGPHISGRIIDLSRGAAERIGLAGAGLGEVKLTVYK